MPDPLTVTASICCTWEAFHIWLHPPAVAADWLGASRLRSVRRDCDMKRQTSIATFCKKPKYSEEVIFYTIYFDIRLLVIAVRNLQREQSGL